MNVWRIVAWGAFWTSKSSQSTSRELLGNLLRAPRELLGALLVAFWCSRGLQTPQTDVKNLFDANLSSQLAFVAPTIASKLASRAPNITIAISISISISTSISISIVVPIVLHLFSSYA